LPELRAEEMGQGMRRRKKRTGIGLIAFFVLSICGIVAYKKIGLEAERDSLMMKKSNLEARIREEEERRTDIKNYEAYVQTKKYIEEIAREKLGLVYDYEILFEKEEKKQ
jgi:cell division protein FtsB